MSAWSEGKIARILARNTFADDLCVLPNCTWTGDEIDLLVVTRCLRIIDVEIKISRADLKADAAKTKWWRHLWDDYDIIDGRRVAKPPVRREWPRKVWKHYYAMPAEMWRDDLAQHVQPVSGVLLVHDDRKERKYSSGRTECVKRAKPRRDAEVIGAGELVQLARLTSLRLWDAYRTIESTTTQESES